MKKQHIVGLMLLGVLIVGIFLIVLFPREKAYEEPSGMPTEPTTTPTPSPIPQFPSEESTAAQEKELAWYEKVNVFATPLMDLPSFVTAIDIGDFAETPAKAQFIALQVSFFHSLGIAYVGQVSIYNIEGSDTLSVYPDLMEALALNIDGEYVDAWWQRFPGVEPYWGSTLHPRWQEFLRGQVERLIDAGVDGIFFDELMGSAGLVGDEKHNGDFNPVVLEGFRTYLQQKYTPKELKDLGIDDISTFNYREFLISKGYAQQVRDPEERWDVPLFHDFYAYIESENRKFVIELMKYAKDYAGQKDRDVAVTANLYGLNSYSLNFAPYVDYFFVEFPFLKDYPKITTCAPILRLGNSFGKRAVLVPDTVLTVPRLLEMGDTATLLQMWIAEAYANGGSLSAPVAYIGSSEGNGRDTIEIFSADMTLMEPYYTFVLEHPECCQSLYTKEDVVLVFHAPSDRDSGEEYRSLFYEASEALLSSNIQYNVLFLDGENSGKLKASIVVLPEPTVPLTEEEEIVLSGAKVIEFHGGMSARDLQAAVIDEIEPIIEVRADKVEAYVFDNTKGLVVNLINKAYDIVSERITDASNIEITISLPEGCNVSSVRMLSPDEDIDISLQFQQYGNKLNFVVPSLHIWDIIIIEY
ncbi:MAG: hypothetical protein DRN92_01265 [Thermoproteota archaeon]|nr:MAG: hypothetical protein DRN92_01265 [Candidatus Korarchaeota archaeon]